MNIVKPFLSENAKVGRAWLVLSLNQNDKSSQDVLVFHGTDFTELHKELSKEILPKELG